MPAPPRPKKTKAIANRATPHKKSAGPSKASNKLNRLLAVLPDEELKRWLPALE